MYVHVLMYNIVKPVLNLLTSKIEWLSFTYMYSVQKNKNIRFKNI